MIVLRLTADGRSWDVQRAAHRILLGTASEADVREDGVGWRPAEAVLHHRGTEVLLERPNEGTQLRLRVGDAVRLGRIRVALVGLLPLPTPSETEPPPVFGDYADDLARVASGFDLAGDDDAAARASPAVAPAPPPAPAPAPPSRAPRNHLAERSPHHGHPRPRFAARPSAASS